MTGFGNDVAIAVVVVIVIFVLLCVFLGFILYFGCGVVCCCHDEKYDVCERAAQDLGRKSSGATGAVVEDAGEGYNPLEQMNASGASRAGPTTPTTYHDGPPQCAPPIVECIQVLAPAVNRGEDAAFEDDNVAPKIETVLVSAHASESPAATEATVETPETTCFMLQPATTSLTVASSNSLAQISLQWKLV